MHGEYKKGVRLADLLGGSPPHAWGILDSEFKDHDGRRITPTCMGNTRTNKCVLVSYQDHPHMHGEYSVFPLKIDYPSGSPPHAWGILG